MYHPQKMPLALVVNIEKKHLSSTNFVTGLASWSNSVEITYLK